VLTVRCPSCKEWTQLAKQQNFRRNRLPTLVLFLCRCGADFMQSISGFWARPIALDSGTRPAFCGRTGCGLQRSAGCFQRILYQPGRASPPVCEGYCWRVGLVDAVEGWTKPHFCGVCGGRLTSAPRTLFQGAAKPRIRRPHGTLSDKGIEA
jgi:hypothetical protein